MDGDSDCVMIDKYGPFQWKPWNTKKARGDRMPTNPFVKHGIDVIRVVLSRGEFSAYECIFKTSYRLSMKRGQWRNLF